jgi:hypothetical protein
MASCCSSVSVFRPGAAKVRALITRREKERHVNPNTQNKEFSLRDPGGAIADAPTEPDSAYVGIYPGGIRSNFFNEESMVSHAWPRMLYVTICGLNWLGSSRLVAWTAISSGIATNVR